MKSGSNSVAHKYNNIVPFPGCMIPQVETEKISKQISKSVKLLEQNPAVDPSKLRKVSFYRSNYKIVKIQVIGIRIENKKINLNPFISLLSNHNKKMTRSWKVFDYDDVNSLQKTIEFESELDKIKNELLLDAGRFGYIMDVNKKKNFIESVNTLKKEFVDFLKGNINKKKENRFVKKSEEQHNKCDLKTLLKNSKEELTAILLSIAKEDKLFIKKICDNDRQLSYKISDGEISADEAVTEYIKRFIDNTLKFPNEDEMINRIDVIIDILDISDELINDNDDFKAVLENYKDKNNEMVLRKYEEGYEHLEQ